MTSQNFLTSNDINVYQLPDVKEPTVNKYRELCRPDISWYTEGQRAIVHGAQEYIRTTDEYAYMLVTGSAGTGKTTAAAGMIESLLWTNMSLRVALVAPTHRAVQVLETKIPFRHRTMQFMTVHSLLGIEGVADEANIRFELVDENKVKLSGYDVVLCDEGSMLQRDLHLLLMKFKGRCKLIYFADIKQLPPVNETTAPIFENRVDVLHFELTEVLRQAEGSPIIKLSNFVAQRRSFISLESHEDMFTEHGDGVLQLHSSLPEERELAYELIDHYFTSENFKSNPDFAKAISYTRKSAELMNAYIRKALYGDYCEKIVTGEKLIADGPIMDKDIILVPNNVPFVVRYYTTEYEHLPNGDKLKYYACRCDVGGEYDADVRILHEDSQAVYTQYLELALKYAKQFKRGMKEYGKAWGQYYELKEYFASVNYNYALTVHKSQGSTFDNTFVLTTDFKYCRSKEVRWKLYYTAFTRAAHKLFIIL